MNLIQKIFNIFNGQNQNRLEHICSGKPLKIHFDNSQHIIPEDLYSLYNGTLPKRKEELLANDILGSVGLTSSNTGTICNEVPKYLSESHTRIETLVHGAQICIPPRNNNELYLIANAYHWAGASYRNEAIYWFELYIKNGAVSDYIQSNIIYEQNYSYDQRIKFVSIAHVTLAELYADEGLYDISNNEYDLAIKIAPFLDSAYVKLAKNYIKQQDFSRVDEIMQTAQKTIFYEIDNSFKENIDRHIVQFEQEIKELKYYTDIIIPEILQTVSQKPGIQQKRLYGMYPQLEPQHIRWICKRLAQEKKLTRVKKGNTYLLYLNNNDS